MNNHPETEEQRNLIHRALADENWNAFDAQLRENARRTFSAAKRRRRLAFVGAQAAALMVVGIAAWSLLQPGKTEELGSRGHESAQNSTVKNSLGLTSAAMGKNSASQLSGLQGTEEPSVSLPKIITEEQMLAMFPAGSCLLAEINGEKQLVFLDPKLANEGFPLPQAFSEHN
jgi:hypothetical protein